MKPRVGGGGRLDHRFQSGVWPPVANFVQHRSVATPNEVRVLDNGRRARVTPPRSRVTGFEVASYVSERRAVCDGGRRALRAGSLHQRADTGGRARGLLRAPLGTDPLRCKGRRPRPGPLREWLDDGLVAQPATRSSTPAQRCRSRCPRVRRARSSAARACRADRACRSTYAPEVV